MSKEQERAIVITMITLRLKQRIDATNACQSTKSGIEGELTMAIDLAHLFGAISLEEQMHYKERLNKILEREHEEWQKANRRIG